MNEHRGSDSKSERSALEADRVKHLEFIQAVITRLGNSSFLIKGWALTISAAFFAVLANRLSWKISLTAFVPLLVFWLLDAYYLRQERLFRCLYDEVRRTNSDVEPFSMNVAAYRHRLTIREVCLSVTLAYFYGALFVVNAAFLFGALTPILFECRP